MSTRSSEQRWAPLERWELLGLAAILAVVIGLSLILALDGAPLAHDESVYATKGRHYVTGANSRGIGYWNDYRAVGLPRLFAASWWLGGTDFSLRVVMIVAAAATVTATWLWGRYLIGQKTALVSAAILCVTPGFFNFAFLLVPDVPATAFGVLAITTFAMASHGERVTGLAYVAVPLAVMATLIRYGAPLLLGTGLAVVAISNWQAVRRSLARTAAVATMMLAPIVAILFVPEVTNSTAAPVLAFRARQTNRGVSSWASYGDIIDLLPRLFGWPTGAVVVIGVVLAVRSVRDGRLDGRGITVATAILVLFLVTLNAGLAHLEVRYLIPALPWLLPPVAAGWVSSWPSHRRGRALGFAATALLVIAATAAAFQQAGDTVASRHRNFGRLQLAAEELRAVASRPCLAITANQPQIVWYSGCDALPYPRWSNPESASRAETQRDLIEWVNLRAGDLEPSTTLYAVSIERDKPRTTRHPPLIEIGEGRVVEIGRPGDGRRQYIWVERLGHWSELREGPTPPSP